MIPVMVLMPGFAGFAAAIVLTPSAPRAGACAACGYDMRGLPAGAACPECGVGASAVRPARARATPRERLLIPAGVVVLGAIIALATIPWRAGNSTPWFLLGLQVLPFVIGACVLRALRAGVERQALRVVAGAGTVGASRVYRRPCCRWIGMPRLASCLSSRGCSQGD